MSKAEDDFCRGLSADFSDIQRLMAEHLGDYDELLPHVFMGEVTRYVLSDGPQRSHIVSRLETALCEGAPKLRELVAVSFVENIETEAELISTVSGIRAPRIVEEWKRQRSH
jgi:hypothetical protein